MYFIKISLNVVRIPKHEKRWK